MRKYQTYIAAAFVALWLRPEITSAQRPLTIGIINGQMDREAARSFEPFTTYLSERIPGTRFQMVPLATIEDLVEAVPGKQLDFAFATPVALVELNVRRGARAIATVLQPAPDGQNYPWLAGAVFVRDSRSDIRRLDDVRGKRVVALSQLALGGWLSAVREWRKAGIREDTDFRSLRFVFSYARIAQEVCEGTADVGILAASALKQVESSCPDKLRVLPKYHGRQGSALSGDDQHGIVSGRGVRRCRYGPGDFGVAGRDCVARNRAWQRGGAGGVHGAAQLCMGPAAPRFRQVIEQHWRKLLITLLGFLIVLGWALVRARLLNARLKAAEGFRKRVFEASHVPVVVMEADTGKYVDCNPADGATWDAKVHLMSFESDHRRLL